MTKEELSKCPRIPLHELIPGWNEMCTASRARIKSGFNLEWWRGYHAASIMAKSADLLTALKAAEGLWDKVQPRKLDEALGWRENDDRIRAMVRSAIARMEGGGP